MGLLQILPPEELGTVSIFIISLLIGVIGVLWYKLAEKEKELKDETKGRLLDYKENIAIKKTLEDVERALEDITRNAK